MIDTDARPGEIPHEDWYIDIMRRAYDGARPNFCDVIAAMNGWLPLDVKEKMIVHFNDREYVIRRTK